MSVRMVLGGAAVRSARTGRAAIKHLLDDDAQHDDDDDDDDDHHHHINEHRTQCDVPLPSKLYDYVIMYITLYITHKLHNSFTLLIFILLPDPCAPQKGAVHLFVI